jgi:beta-phosphoglucomutase
MTKPDAAVIWDVDGTLVDTAELHFQAWVELAVEIGRPFTRADFAATFGRRNPEIIRAVFDPTAGDALVADLGERKERRYREAAKNAGVELLPGAAALLAGVRALGWAQAVGSSAPRANLDLILELTATREFFAAVVAMEDTTRGKPDPQVFQVAADRLGMPYPRCVVFEDAVAGVQAAKAGGMRCVAVRFVGHHPEAALRDAGTDLVVESLDQITAEHVRRLLLDQ